MASSLTSYLPPQEGLLPKWLVFTALISIANSIQAFMTLHYTFRVYNPNHPWLPARISFPYASSSSDKNKIASQVTPLSARTFGTWTLLASVVRMLVAYHIDEKAWYELGMWTYGIAWAHFMSEWLVFGTAKWGMPIAGPVVVANGSLLWMVMQKAWYVKG
ncbi:ergosterol biosynthesis protein-like protein [Polyplosphaeria fusca]|uniref:Ergosterol biosynthesis protein-like protein n=1 Tax=Polyplosphaeria fusca TaxID=682080 RepID=A0A9P4QV55_9PLEO|nr:ergosterol biosynthesis protein-like protein [Polyplosphaeria fusca]